MVQDFGRSFEGVTPEDAGALADSFRFENCVVRADLARVLNGDSSRLTGGRR
jgi:hypothetical protein